MEVTIKPEDIDKYVQAAIIESSIGKVIKESAEKFMKQIMDNHWDSPVKKIVESIVWQLIRDQIETPENLKMITEHVHAHFTDSIVKEIIGKTVERMR